jgi:GH24 family phage-related lysozyme (muramidase)
MLAYDHAGGRVLKGLTNRRREERDLCMRND